ncbi:unnamed protein product, partial [Iphiclides podalirius]
MRTSGRAARRGVPARPVNAAPSPRDVVLSPSAALYQKPSFEPRPETNNPADCLLRRVQTRVYASSPQQCQPISTSYTMHESHIDVAVSGFASANLFKSQKPVVKIACRKRKRKYPPGRARQLLGFGANFEQIRNENTPLRDVGHRVSNKINSKRIPKHTFYQLNKD